MNDEMEDLVDVLLREQFEGPVPADGFCDRVMQQLPVRRCRARWPLAAGALAGMAACWLTLWSTPLTYIAWRDWFSGELSASAIALFSSMAGMAILAALWTIAEAEDRYEPSSRPLIR